MLTKNMLDQNVFDQTSCLDQKHEYDQDMCFCCLQNKCINNFVLQGFRKQFYDKYFIEKCL